MTKVYPARRRGAAPVRAVDGVQFRRGRPARTLGLVGESGCGKVHHRPYDRAPPGTSSGSVSYDGRDISHLPQRELKPLRREIQIGLPGPALPLNPRQTVARIISDPCWYRALRRRGRGRGLRAAELMELVGLIPEHIDRYPHEFSGGQAQRIGIARALATGPRLVIADETGPALDVSVQAQIVNLMDASNGTGPRLPLHRHDLSVVKRVCDRVAVMYLGRVVEIGAKERVYAARPPLHPRTALRGPPARPGGRAGPRAHQRSWATPRARPHPRRAAPSTPLPQGPGAVPHGVTGTADHGPGRCAPGRLPFPEAA